MAVGWAKDGAVQEQIEATVNEAIELAKSRLPDGKSLTHCEECEEEIPQARQKAIPGVRYCINCQSDIEQQQAIESSFNRRANKDSQLK